VADAARQALEAGMKALSRRELSRNELLAKLERSGLRSEDAERAISQLVAAGYQSDERTAEERCRVLGSRLYGDLAIRHDLERRGIAEESIDSALAIIEPERSRAAALARRTGDPTKLARTLHAKGYTQDTIEATLHMPDPQG
jgi:regulatory protein